MKNRTLAILAAPAAIPPNPNIAAIIASITKVTVQRNIIYGFRLVNFSVVLIRLLYYKDEDCVPFTLTLKILILPLNNLNFNEIA